MIECAVQRAAGYDSVQLSGGAGYDSVQYEGGPSIIASAV